MNMSKQYPAAAKGESGLWRQMASEAKRGMWEGFPIKSAKNSAIKNKKKK